MTDADPALHAARRLTWGPTPMTVDEIRLRGVAGWVDQQLALGEADTAGDDSTLAPALAALSTLGLRGDQLAQLADKPALARRELITATILRAWLSGAQLREVMTDLWWNHFNIDAGAVPPGWATLYDRDTIRPNCLGRVSDLLRAVTQSPAMLAYLDNAASAAGRGRVPNENHARELLELHTVGVDGGYDDDDVVEVAHLLSGWTVQRSNASFAFDARRHDLGPLSNGDVLGWRPATDLSSLEQGEDLLDHLAHTSQMANRVARLLVTRFVADDVAAHTELVEDLADVYLSSDTDIGAMLRHLVQVDAFTSPPLEGGRKARRPLDFLVAALRGLGARPDSDDPALRRTLGEMSAMLGQVPHAWPAPDGYPDEAGVWLTPGGLIPRWQVAAALVARPPGIAVPAFSPDPSMTAATAIDQLRIGMTGAAPDDGTLAALLSAVGTGPDTPVGDVDAVAVGDLRSLVLSSAEFQLR